MTVIRATFGGDGEATTQTMPNTGGVSSSEDYQPSGVTVHTNGLGLAKTVNSIDELSPGDKVTIDGVQMDIEQAQQLGLLSGLFANTASNVTNELTPEANTDGTDTEGLTGHAEYDNAVASLNEYLEDGSMTHDEAIEYDSTLAQVAMDGISVDHLVETIDGLQDGSIAELEVPAGVRETARVAEEKVTQASTDSARAELGDEGFANLQRLASVNPQVNYTIRRYAIDRAQGKHDGVTWAGLSALMHETIAG